jgi:hypothetical protein
MNFNLEYSKGHLIDLVNHADMELDQHNLVISFDGEVMIDPEKYYPQVPVSSYQFSTCMQDASLRQNEMIGILYDTLEMVYRSRTTINTDAGHIPHYDARVGVAA